MSTHPDPGATHDNAASRTQSHHDDESLGSIRARRNLLTGYWAGSLIGLSGDDLSRYAGDLHEADHAQHGDSDVIAHLSRDLDAAGHKTTRTEIAAALRRFHAQALKDTGCTE
jgi:hypothetical protein